MSARHRRKRNQSKGELITSYLDKLRETLIEAARHKFGADFTPEMEALFRAEFRPQSGTQTSSPNARLART